jgi:hypothetical protein
MPVDQSSRASIAVYGSPAGGTTLFTSVSDIFPARVAQAGYDYNGGEDGKRDAQFHDRSPATIVLQIAAVFPDLTAAILKPA